MIEAQKVKNALMVVPQAVGTDTVSGYVDTLGADYVAIRVIGDTAAAADVMTTLKLQHGDTTSAFTDISGAVGGTDFTIPAPNTSTGDIIEFFLDRESGGGLKRYVNAVIVGDATTRLMTVTGQLSRLKEGPTTDAEAGATERIFV